MSRRNNPRVWGPIRFSRTRRWTVYGIALGLWGSGVGWLALRYALRRDGQFGPEAHPLEPWALKAHGAFAFAALWLMGVVWAAHLVNGWRAGRRRWSGAVLFGLALLLIASGWLLYYAGDDQLRDGVSKLHWVAGLGAPLALLAHRFVRERDRMPRPTWKKPRGNRTLTASSPHRQDWGSSDERAAEPERAT